MTDPSATQQQELIGWKEISNYLGISVRTAQEYEIHLDLPIHRLEGRGKPRVRAFSLELDEWKRRQGVAPGSLANLASQDGGTPASPVNNQLLPSPEGATKQETADKPERLTHTANRRINYQSWPIFLAGTVLVCLIAWAGLLYWRGFVKNRQPSRIRVQADTLFVLDEKGRELWNYTFPEGLGSYPADERSLRALYLTEDLDGDGQKELVFVHNLPPQDAGKGNRLVLFKGGKRVRSVVPGRALVYGPDHHGDVRFTKPYGLTRLILIPGKPHPKVAITSLHHEEAPSQVLILDGQLNVVGEYWHPGHLTFMIVGDIEQDGRAELILGGVNNRHHCATVVVLDPNNVSGTTRAIMDPRVPDTRNLALHEYGEDEEHLTAIPQGTEKYVVLFPRSYLEFDGKRALHEYNRVQEIKSAQGTFMVAVAEEENQESLVTILYDLDWRLNVVSAKPSKAFQDLQWDRFKDRTLDHPYSKKDREQLERNVIVVRYR